MKIPKYLKIQEDFIRDIENGVYRPGEIIPSDNELMKSLKVSKSTITQALKSLSDKGYITRQQGRGTFVAEQRRKPAINVFICPTERREEIFWNEIKDAFNQGTHSFEVKISFIYNDLVPLRDTLLKAFAGGMAPDILSLDGPDVPYWAYMNSIRPLDDFVNEEFKNRFIPHILKQGTYQGKLYHLGYNESTLCILYNKKLFEKIGIVPPSSIEQAWSWEEFLSICQFIKRKTSIRYPLLMDSGRGLSMTSGEWVTYSAFPFITQNNGSFFNDACTQATGYLNSKETVEALEWLGKLFTPYEYTHILDIHEQFPNDFAMSFSLPNAFFDTINNNESDNIGIIPLPKHIRSASPHGGWGLCMSKQTQYPYECWEFISYFFSIENQLKLNKYTGIPVLKILYEAFNNFNLVSNNTNILFSQLHNSAVTRPITPAYPAFSRLFSTAYINIAKGGNAQALLDDAADQVDEHLRRHNYFSQ